MANFLVIELDDLELPNPFDPELVARILHDLTDDILEDGFETDESRPIQGCLNEESGNVIVGNFRSTQR